MELERRRPLAVARVSEGDSQQEVAAFPGVHRGTVSRWVCTARERGADALQAKPTPGRPRKLTARQEKTVPGWIVKPPPSFGFATDRWTSRRLAGLIHQRLGIHCHSNPLVEWLRAREHTPQKPDQPARERDQAAMARWKDEDGPRRQKSQRGKGSPRVAR